MRVKGELTPRPKGRSDEAIAKRKEAVTARNAAATTQQSIREKRDEWRTKGREDLKKIRSENKMSPERREKIAASKVFHKTDNQGNPGGVAAVAEYAKKITKKPKASTVASDRKAAALAKASKAKSMKEKMSMGSYTIQDKDFFKRNAKQRGMSVADYYAKYVK